MGPYSESVLLWKLGERDGERDLRELSHLPFLGFLAGSVLSASIWAAMLGAVWVWSHLPI